MKEGVGGARAFFINTGKPPLPTILLYKKGLLKLEGRRVEERELVGVLSIVTAGRKGENHEPAHRGEKGKKKKRGEARYKKGCSPSSPCTEGKRERGPPILPPKERSLVLAGDQGRPSYSEGRRSKKRRTASRRPKKKERKRKKKMTVGKFLKGGIGRRARVTRTTKKGKLRFRLERKRKDVSAKGGKKNDQHLIKERDVRGKKGEQRPSRSMNSGHFLYKKIKEDRLKRPLAPLFGGEKESSRGG